MPTPSEIYKAAVEAAFNAIWSDPEFATMQTGVLAAFNTAYSETDPAHAAIARKGAADTISDAVHKFVHGGDGTKVGALAQALADASGVFESGVGQPVNGNLTALSGLTGAADRVPYFTGLAAMATATLTGYGRSLIAAVDAATAKTALSLGKGDVGLSAVDNVQQMPLSYLDIDPTLGANSDVQIPSQKAIKAFVTAMVAGLLDFKGGLAAVADPDYPAAAKGDAYAITSAGKVGGASGVSVDIGDMVVATADNAGGSQAAVGTSWIVLEHNLVGAILGSQTPGGDLAGAGSTYTTPLLTAVGPGAGSAGGASSIPVVTIDAKGRITGLSTATVDDTSKIPLSLADAADQIPVSTAAGVWSKFLSTTFGRSLVAAAAAADAKTLLSLVKGDVGLGSVDNVQQLPLSYLDTDPAMAANSDTRVPSQAAVRSAISTAVTGLFDLKGSTDCSANPNYPAAVKGDAYVVSVAGKIGGASGTVVDLGDLYFAIADNAGGTQAAVGTSWMILEHNLLNVYLKLTGGTLTGPFSINFASSSGSPGAMPGINIVNPNPYNAAGPSYSFANVSMTATPTAGTNVVADLFADGGAFISGGALYFRSSNGHPFVFAFGPGLPAGNFIRMEQTGIGMLNGVGAPDCLLHVGQHQGSATYYATTAQILSTTPMSATPVSLFKIVRGFASSVHYPGAMEITLAAYGAGGGPIFAPTTEVGFNLKSVGSWSEQCDLRVMTLRDDGTVRIPALATANCLLLTSGTGGLIALDTGLTFAAGRLTTPKLTVITDIALGQTITTPGTTGAQTINKSTGRVNFAIGATSLVVTNSLVTANSIVQAIAATNDATGRVTAVVAGAGSFTIYAVAPTAEMAVNFLVTN